MVPLSCAAERMEKTPRSSFQLPRSEFNITVLCTFDGNQAAGLWT